MRAHLHACVRICTTCIYLKSLNMFKQIFHDGKYLCVTKILSNILIDEINLTAQLQHSCTAYHSTCRQIACKEKKDNNILKDKFMQHAAHSRQAGKQACSKQVSRQVGKQASRQVGSRQHAA